eukprot:3040280-Rhodomonas_salina.2
MSHLENLVKMVAEALMQLLNLLLYMISTISDIGKIIVEIAIWVCKVVMMMYKFVVEWLLCGILRFFIWAAFGIMDGVVSILKIIKTAPLIGYLFEWLNTDPWDDFKDKVDDFLDSLPCVIKEPWKAAIPVYGVVVTAMGSGDSVFAGDLRCELPFGYSDSSASAHAFLAT